MKEHEVIALIAAPIYVHLITSDTASFRSPARHRKDAVRLARDLYREADPDAVTLQGEAGK